MILNKQMKRLLLVLALMFTYHLTAHADTIMVPAGGNLQAAINAAQPGDTIITDAGAIYRNDFVLPNKPGSDWITIQSSRAAELPADVRVGPSQSALFTKLQSANLAAPVITTAPGAHHYRFIGIEISTAGPTQVYDLVQIGSGTQTAADIPHHFIFDRTYIHGFATQEVQRGIALNGAEITVSNSYISEIHGVGYDTQALCGWNGPGPFYVLNNYLEAAGENIMFGGALPSITDLIPSNIEIRGNNFFKPLRWKVGDPSYDSIHWTAKNLLEFKNARNVVIDSNTFENSWGDAQVGYAILFTVRSENGLAPWAVIKNITLSNNVVLNSEQGIQIQGIDVDARTGVLNPSQGCSDLQVVNNKFVGIRHWFIVLNQCHNTTIEHNTHEQGNNILVLTGNPSQNFVYRNNVTTRMPETYGIFGDGIGEGTAALNKYAPGYDVRGNVIAGAPAGGYPAGNFYPVDLSGLPALKGTDGLTPGYSAGTSLPSPSPTVQPIPSPTVTPMPTPVPSPSATPVPTPLPTPIPTPVPTPLPTPQPTPAPCSMTIAIPTLDQWTSGLMQVHVMNATGTYTVSAVGTSGQVVVSQPTTSKPMTGTSALVQFLVSAKKKSAVVNVSGPCGQQTVMVPVRP